MSCIERIPLKRPCMVITTLLHHHPQSSGALKRNKNKNLKQIFPEKEFRGHKPNFHIHCVCERFIYFHNRSAFSAAEKYVD
jgi:hypothetical protein